MQVLNVEDDTTMAKTVELMLRKEGHDCDTTNLGELAIELAQQNQYDFILLDVMLPDIDGFEVIERMHAAGIEAPFLITSGLVDRESEFGGLAFGGGDYLVKPFTKKELLKGMQNVLTHWQLSHRSGLDGAGAQPCEPLVFGDERRRHRRFRTVKPAKILESGGVPCTIVNMSHGGACVRLSDKDFECPDTFDLQLQSGPIYLCEVRWRQGDRFGVKFLKLK